MNELKEGFLSNSDVPVAKRRQQRGDSVTMWVGIVDQIIIGPFKVNEWFNLNNATIVIYR